MNRLARSTLRVLVPALVVAAIVASAASWLNREDGKAGPTRIFVMNADGSGVARFTEDTSAGNWGPAWSPDGRSMAYTILDHPADIGTLWVHPFGGGQRVKVGAGYLAAWSPDGMRLVYMHQETADPATSEVTIVAADGTGERRLTSNEAQEYGATWSPAGDQVVYGSAEDGTWQLYIVNADGTGQRKLETGAGGNAPDWSSDGRSIVFQSNRLGTDDLFVLELATGEVRRLTDDPDRFEGTARWSPDGSRIAFRSVRRFGDDDIEVMNADGSGRINLTNSPAAADLFPTWSPDGKRIAFHSLDV